MRTYPARLVGHFERGGLEWQRDMPNIGDCALVHYLSNGVSGESLKLHIHCACADIHIVTVQRYDGKQPMWELRTTDPIHIEPSVRTEAPPLGVCHFFLRGELQMLDDSTRQMH